jgi:histidine ammonia-lyase
MKNNKDIILDGNSLTIEDVYAVAHHADLRVSIAPSAIALTKKARAFLESEFQNKIIYGVNTGFGPMASHIIGRDELAALQKNLIRGHAMGMGTPMPEENVVAAMVVRLNTLCRGYSGVSPDLLERFAVMINKRIVPVVPEHGAVGTSGDLVQLAHIALAIIGEGEVFYKGVRQRTKKVFKLLKIKPYTLKPKEGLSLINGTSMMAGIAALICVEAGKLVDLSIRNGACALEVVGAFSDGISEALQNARPQAGQKRVARALRELLASSGRLHERIHFQKQFTVTEEDHVIPERVQEVYSLRCIPQVVGPVADILEKVRKEVNIEINSATDNPLIDLKGKTFLHGGNFHGDYMAAGIDQLKASLVKLTMLSERRINFFLNRGVNNFFPPFLNLKTPGLTMGLQGLQFVATSTTAQSQSFAFPHHVHSIPTNADNQDIVSMGTDAAMIAARVIDNAYIVMAIELVTLSQAMDCFGQKSTYSKSSRQLVQGVRRVLPAIVEDRDVNGTLEKVVQYARRDG